jgi:hypothetical protein
MKLRVTDKMQNFLTSSATFSFYGKALHSGLIYFPLIFHGVVKSSKLRNARRILMGQTKSYKILMDKYIFGKVTIGVLGFDSRRGLGIFLFTNASRTAQGPTQPPIQWVPGALSLGLKRSGREADHSPPYSAEVKE